MTRFARIKGKSKPSFNKTVEEATTWEEMKRKVESSDDEVEENDIIQETLKEPVANEVKTVWCDFGDETSNKSSKKRKKKKSVQKVEESDEVEGKSDEVKKYVAEVKTVCDEKSTKKRKKKKKQKVEGSIDEEVETKDVLNYKRRKPEQGDMTLVIDGEEVKLKKFEGFYVKEADAVRLGKLRIELKKQGLPDEEVNSKLKRARRNAEKSLSKCRKKLCFHCRRSGHLLSDCPEVESEGVPSIGSGICYKCGSTEHALFQCKAPWAELKYASCFVCKAKGHLSKSCPDNPRGLYPNGGGCRICGDVTHLKFDCPKNLKNKRNQGFTVGTINDSVEGIDDDQQTPDKINYQSEKKVKKIKFK